jgi:hypothetical protein
MHMRSGAPDEGGRELLVGLDTASSPRRLTTRLIPIEII